MISANLRRLPSRSYRIGLQSRNMAATTDRHHERSVRRIPTHARIQAVCTRGCIACSIISAGTARSRSGGWAVSVSHSDPTRGEPIMKDAYRISCAMIVLAASLLAPARAEAQDVKEKAFDAPHNVKIKVRMEGPYTA